MELSLTTPALLFPAISLLLLAYTQRFLTLAAIIRSLHDQYKREGGEIILKQIDNLRKRVYIIRDMQGLGIGSLFLCVLSMFLVYSGKEQIASAVFGASLLFMMASLGLMIREISLSVGALELVLGDLHPPKPESGNG
jgi:hypothetical protein